MSLGMLGPYEIITTLGSGARGTVFRARHATLGRIVAIKQIVATVTPDGVEYRRLLAEVEQLKSVPARHVAAVMSVDLVEGRPLIEMESLGESLDRALRQRPLDAREALRVVMDVLTGLSDLHAMGIVHGNLKPANVLQDTTNRAWKIADGGMTGIYTDSSPTLLATSVLYGAPETVSMLTQGDARSDLYSAGMVGLESLLGGNLLEAFPAVGRAASPGKWLAWLQDPSTEARSLSELRPEIPVEVSDFVARLLAKDPSRRYPSADAALEAMEAMLPVVHAAQLVPGSVPSSAPTPVPASRSTPAPTLIATPAPSLRSAASSTPAPHAGPTPVPTVATGTRIVVTGPHGFEERFELGDRTLRIGRDSKNDICLPDDTKAVSRMHAEIRLDQGRYVLVDLDSQNGLWVNGKRKATIPLGPGMAIKVGAYVLTVNDAAVTPAPVVAQRPAQPVDPGKAVSREAAVPTGWLSPKTRQQWTIVGSIAAVLVAGIVWMSWPKGPGAEERARQEQARLEQERQYQDYLAKEKQEKDRQLQEQKTETRKSALASAMGHVQNKEWQLALDQVAPVLAENAADEEALRIKDIADKGLAANELVKNPANQKGSPGKPKQGPSTITPPVNQQHEALSKLFDEANRMPDPAAALARFQEIQRADSTFRPEDIAREIGNRRRMVVDSLIREARDLEQRRDLVKARDTYLRAKDVWAEAPQLQDPMAALAVRMKREGDEALAAAKGREAFPETRAQAIPFYEIALKYLLPGDEGWKLARDRLAVLKK